MRLPTAANYLPCVGSKRGSFPGAGSLNLRTLEREINARAQRVLGGSLRKKDAAASPCCSWLLLLQLDKKLEISGKEDWTYPKEPNNTKQQEVTKIATSPLSTNLSLLPDIGRDWDTKGRQRHREHK